MRVTVFTAPVVVVIARFLEPYYLIIAALL